jgi:hypothetical protein
MPISNPKEEIDERVLRLIGLDDIFDLDYDTYLTLLKEAMVKGRMTNKTIPTEEIMLLTDEYKKVRSKKNKGRFEVKKKKISSTSFDVGNVKGLITGKNSTKTLPQSVISTSPLIKGLEDNISAISSAVISISETLKQQQKIKDSTRDFDRKKEEQEKRSLAESKLEKRFEGLKKIAEKIISPVKSTLDKIISFFTNIILGRIVYKLVEWLGDPKNVSKVKSIIRFIGDWWPALLGSYILFGNSFGKLIRGTLGIVGRFIFQIGKVGIPQLLRFIKSPLGIGAGLFTAGATIPALFPGTVNEQEGKTDSASGSSADKIKALQQQKSNLNFFDKLWGKGAEIDEQISYLQSGKTKSYGFSGGGFAEGYVSGEKGIDKVPAMLSDGEFVMSRGAVQKYGVDTLEAMNAAGGGTNKPKVMSGKIYAAGGGLVGGSDSDKFVGSAGYYLNEILKGLAPQYKWANDLARKAGVSVQNTIGQAVGGAASSYNSILNQGVNAQKYLSGGGLEKDVSKLMQSGTQFGAGLYDQALKIGNQALSEVQSGGLQKKAADAASQISQAPKKAGVGFFDFMSNMSSSKKYKEGAGRMERAQDTMISFGDKFVKNLPDGPFKEIADKGLIPIPSGNATMMRNLTFAKALLGPLGRPFKILSNKEVDAMRQKTIEKTMGKSGLMVDPKTGQVKMNWNQEDINKRAKGGGAYTDDLGPRGAAFNSILGRFSASTDGKGNTLYSDDRYNFNRSVGEYASLAKQGLMKGSMSDATYYGASMLGRFAQDIGWLNQRALGSRIKIGEINRSNLDPRTGKNKTPQQIAAEKKAQTTAKYGQGVKLYDKPQKNTGESYKSRFARPRNAGVKPVSPPVSRKPKVVYGPPVPSSKRSGGGRGGSSNKPPRFTAGTRGMRSKQETLGLMR